MKPVLVTGGNRTGTSWVGKMLCLSRELFLVWEPFNCMFPAMFSKHPLKRHYRKLLPEEDSAMKSYVKKKTFSEILNHSEGGKTAADKIRKLGAVLAKTAGYISGTRAPLYKDPTALMSAEWFEQQFQSRVVLTVRHPGAYVHSIRRLNWPMHVEEFANQPWLMETLPEAIQNEVRERIASRERPKGYVLEDAALCWKVFHQVSTNTQKIIRNGWWQSMRISVLITFRDSDICTTAWVFPGHRKWKQRSTISVIRTTISFRVMYTTSSSRTQPVLPDSGRTTSQLQRRIPYEE